MAASFLDISAVVKRYIQEVGSAGVRTLATPATGHFLYLLRITNVELTSALARRRNNSLTARQAGAALNQFRQDFVQDYRILEVTIPLLQRASLLADTHALRAYDAVQLAGALEGKSQGPALVLVSADDDLNAAATAEGLTVENPNA